MDIVIDRISKSFGEKQVLADFSATIPQGSITILMAPSGAGKTTLLRLLMGLEQADSGSITGLPRGLAVQFQNDRLIPAMNPVHNLRLTCGRQVPREEICVLLTRLGLSDSLKLPVGSFSGGMARRVSLARALLAPGELLLLDEPFSGLDEANRLSAAETILDYRRGRTTVVVTHREEDAQILKADRIIQM